MRVVLDTNVVVSRFLSNKGAPARIFGLLDDELVQLLVSDAILDEYRRALTYPRVSQLHGLTRDEIDQIVADLRDQAILVSPQQRLAVVVDDPDDDKFIECGVAGSAVAIISGNKHLLNLREYEGILILSPSAFLTWFTSLS